MTIFKQPRRYGQGDRIHVQAQQIWQILSSLCIVRRLDGGKPQPQITYGELAVAMGKPAQAGRTLTRQLWMIGEYCKDAGIPTLNSIVVNQETGLPGHDVVLTTGRSAKQEMRAVAEFDWSGIAAPSAGTLLSVWNAIKA